MADAPSSMVTGGCLFVRCSSMHDAGAVPVDGGENDCRSAEVFMLLPIFRRNRLGLLVKAPVEAVPG